MEYTPNQLSEMLPLGKDVRIAAVHPAGLIAFDKPAGIMTHPNKEEDLRSSLLRASYDLDSECYTLEAPLSGGEQTVSILNRLDSPTSGIVLAALDASIATHVSQMFREGRVHKNYYALIKGRPSVASRLWADRLQVVRGKGHVRSQSGGVRQARTHVQLMYPDSNGLGVYLIQLTPMTGRTHQLRLQCSLRDCPIVGDRTYGNFKFNREVQKAVDSKRLFLHAAEIRVPLPVKGSFDVKVPLPEIFDQLMKPNPALKRAFLG